MKRKGFSLLELMVTVVIVGILAAAGVPLYEEYVKKTRTAEAKNALGDIYSSQLIFYDDPLLTGPTPRFATSLKELGWKIEINRGEKFVGKKPAEYTYGTSEAASCASVPDANANYLPPKFDKLMMKNLPMADVEQGTYTATSETIGLCI